MPALAPLEHAADRTETDAWFADVRSGLGSGALAPYLGPGLTALSAAPVPSSYEALAAFLETKVPLPRRARGNLWAAAQYIESQRHRSVLVTLLSEAFAPPVPPLPFHDCLAKLPLPLIVDTWYDGAMRAALLGGRGGPGAGGAAGGAWGEIQAVSRAKIGETAWTRAYDRAGEPATPEGVAAWETLLYKPHGAIHPHGTVLCADSDYVETLTEIDIQSPIPEMVKVRRASVGFVFLGCRFHDQLLRTYARQIAKRSRGPNFIVVEPAGLTRNERRFVEELQMRPLVSPLGDALARLAAP